MSARIAVILCLVSMVACVRRVETASDLPRTATSPQTPVSSAPEGPAASTEGAPADRTIRPDPIVVTVTKAELAISELSDEELFRAGTSAMGGGDNLKALLHFERLADHFPESPRRPQSLYNAGILLLKMKENAGAARRFSESVRAFGATTTQGIDARFRLADALYFVGDVDGAVGTLEKLSQETGIPAVRRVEANVKRGVCQFNAGRLAASESTLREALDEIREHLREEVRDAYLPSQAEFYLGEVQRQQFINAPFDPGSGTEAALFAALEAKAQLLLNAQSHYVRCMRIGHGEWATASGYRVGELYELFHHQMLEARAPTDLDAERAEVYREEVRKKVRVLVEKAVHVYEKTLQTADRVGATNPFIAQTKVQLDRLRGILRDTPADKADSKPSENKRNTN